MRIKFNNEDKLGLNKKWIRKIILTAGVVFTAMALIEILNIIFQPKDYQLIISTLGEHYILRLIIGILFLISWYLIKKIKTCKIIQ
jgi:hypothetical protein